MEETSYHHIADRIAAAIASGEMKPGERLPPQREFAASVGIAVSTAARVYRELFRRGLVVGEVGRGTFVRAGAHRVATDTPTPSPSIVNLELNVTVLPDEAAQVARALAPILRRPAVLDATLQLASTTGTPDGRETVARFLSRPGWAIDPDGVSFAGNGKQALAAAVAALVPLGGRLGVDSVTYPIIKSLTASLGIVLVPLPMDDQGLLPEGIEAAHRQTPLQAIYCQPVLHNPLGTTWPLTRAAEIASVLERNNIFAIEDHVYAFLAADTPPLAALTPQRSVVVDSLSKRLAPGLTLGFLIAPRNLVPSITAAIRFGAWGPLALPMELSVRLMADGTAAAIAAAKRADAQARQVYLSEAMAGLALQANPLAYHGWLTLPDRWRAEAFVTAAAQRGIAITPASAFAVDTGAIPNAVRIALASPPAEVLARALRTLADLARRGPEELTVEG